MESRSQAQSSVLLRLLAFVALLLLAVAGFMAWRAWRTEIGIAWNWNAATAPITQRGGGFSWWSGPSAPNAEKAEDLVAYINFDNLPIDDADVAEIVERFPNLGGIQLENTQITDESLRLLESCPKLGYVKLAGTAVSVEAVQRLCDARGAWFTHPTAGQLCPANIAVEEAQRIANRYGISFIHPVAGLVRPASADDDVESGPAKVERTP